MQGLRRHPPHDTETVSDAELGSARTHDLGLGSVALDRKDGVGERGHRIHETDEPAAPGEATLVEHDGRLGRETKLGAQAPGASQRLDLGVARDDHAAHAVAFPQHLGTLGVHADHGIRLRHEIALQACPVPPDQPGVTAVTGEHIGEELMGVVDDAGVGQAGDADTCRQRVRIVAVHDIGRDGERRGDERGRALPELPPFAERAAPGGGGLLGHALDAVTVALL